MNIFMILFIIIGICIVKAVMYAFMIVGKEKESVGTLIIGLIIAIGLLFLTPYAVNIILNDMFGFQPTYIQTFALILLLDVLGISKKDLEKK
jgi:hypothetical protein